MKAVIMYKDKGNKIQIIVFIPQGNCLNISHAVADPHYNLQPQHQGHRPLLYHKEKSHACSQVIRKDDKYLHGLGITNQGMKRKLDDCCHQNEDSLDNGPLKF